jgi:hypothetical protein
MKIQKSTSKYDFFLSGKWRNKEKILKLTDDIRQKDYNVYCFFDSKMSTPRLNNDPEEEMENFEKLDWKTDPLIKEMFETDLEAERNSSIFVMLLPAGKSCHIEAGIAYGLGKKCILIGEQKEAESLYLIFDEAYLTEEEFLMTL